MSASERFTTVIQGEYAISSDPSEVLTTLLGSCVSVCLFDADRGIGGMNHFLLPEREGQHGAQVRYGAFAMELLINELLKNGATKSRLQAKIFGGARMNAALRDIGASNTAFTRKFLAEEGVPCVGAHTGGTAARRIRFWPTTGLARQMLVTQSVDAEVASIPAVAQREEAITLF